MKAFNLVSVDYPPGLSGVLTLCTNMASITYIDRRAYWNLSGKKIVTVMKRHEKDFIERGIRNKKGYV